MRSSKSRSRNKNRNRPSGGNIINRVFDSSGPEGKVRGTPQQIIDKYNQLARDAQLAGDRVAVENFQQHAEHYTRLLAQAQKEMDAKREQQQGGQQNNPQAGQQGGQQGGGNQQGGGQPQDQQGGQQQRDQQDGQGGDPRGGRNQDEGRGQGGGRRGRRDRNEDRQPDVIEPDGDSGLVETPEAKAEAQPEVSAAEEERPKRRTRRKAPKAEEPKAEDAGDQAAQAEAS
ncbi:DUF4167 domain-containing protein [Jannaschia aquimarina]|uniref:DUF4167 domain-containing protein n=1 Tax=Jannaschia aquimarina TaxID=935700 RepID=A0A0D1ELN4_9RHOB|nr:DUF4167 domain-containing protein [Jannaschia aquimarina]KIT17836.1 hypothetical protein jaqu_04260 [Jannaschia aquimarina]SNS90376.1 protein of unknown function [Jannaschia aquimarina]